MDTTWTDRARTELAALTRRLTPQPLDATAVADALALATHLLSHIDPHAGLMDVVAADLSFEMAKAELARCLHLPDGAHPLLAEVPSQDTPPEVLAGQSAALIEASSAALRNLECSDPLAHAAALAHLAHAARLLRPS